MTNSLLSATIDAREPDWIQHLRFGGIETNIGVLDVSDLLAICDDGAVLAIERKTVDDLLGSIADDRLFAQLLRLQEVSEYAYLVICGVLQAGPGGRVFANGRETGWGWGSVQGALLSAQEMGVHVVFAASDTDYEATVLRLAQRSREKARIPPHREFSILSPAEAFIAGLPGIGPERVEALLAHCGTPALALDWLSNPRLAAKVPGVGPGTKKAVRRLLGLKETEMLGVIDIDTHKEQGSAK